ncbi:hypothetical protein [Acinetobacter baumannii]|uniref:hypothetical protein n=1 Tax=Acinetobacter baumannii TaxID=470 RepID=UPI0038920177
MQLNFLTIEQVITILSEKTKTAWNTYNIADLLINNHLELVFWFEGYAGVLSGLHLQDGIDEQPLKAINKIKGFVRPNDIHFQDIYDLLLDAKEAIDISLVGKGAKISVLFPNCSEELITEILSNVRHDKKNRQLIYELGLLENAPLSVFHLSSKGISTSIQVTASKLRITKESLDRFMSSNEENVIESKAVSMSSDKAIAIMAMMLSKNVAKFKVGNRPNASQLGKEIDAIAQNHFKEEDLRGLESFNKRISAALKTYEKLTNSKN